MAHRLLALQNSSKPLTTTKWLNKIKKPFHNAIYIKFVKKASTQDPIRSLRYIKYYSLNTISDFKHFSNSISNNCQKVSSRTGSEANLSENKVTNSIFKQQKLQTGSNISNIYITYFLLWVFAIYIMCYIKLEIYIGRNFLKDYFYWYCQQNISAEAKKSLIPYNLTCE